MEEKYSNLEENIRETCRQFNGKLEAAFVKGWVGTGLQKRAAMIMLIGPRLTLQSLAQLRNEMLEAFEAKKEQLLGKMGPGEHFNGWDMWTKE